MIVELPKPLRCIYCGYVAHYLINGASYCRICAVTFRVIDKWWIARCQKEMDARNAQ